MALKTFEKFGELPYDIRYLIWKEALYEPQRTVSVHAPCSHKKAVCRIPLPALARVCQESRTICMIYGQYWDDRAWLYPGSHLTLLLHKDGELPPPFPWDVSSICWDGPKRLAIRVYNPDGNKTLYKEWFGDVLISRSCMDYLKRLPPSVHLDLVLRRYELTMPMSAAREVGWDWIGDSDSILVDITDAERIKRIVAGSVDQRGTRRGENRQLLFEIFEHTYCPEDVHRCGWFIWMYRSAWRLLKDLREELWDLQYEFIVELREKMSESHRILFEFKILKADEERASIA